MHPDDAVTAHRDRVAGALEVNAPAIPLMILGNPVPLFNSLQLSQPTAMRNSTDRVAGSCPRPGAAFVSRCRL